jgi:hypothetical protein
VTNQERRESYQTGGLDLDLPQKVRDGYEGGSKLLEQTRAFEDNVSVSLKSFSFCSGSLRLIRFSCTALAGLLRPDRRSQVLWFADGDSLGSVLFPSFGFSLSLTWIECCM